MAPSHGTFAVLCKSFEYLVEISSDVVVYRNHCTVDKRNPRAFAKGIEFHEHHHLEENTWHEFHKTIVGNGVRKLLSELSTDTVEIVLLEVSVRAEMIAYKNGHYLAFRESALAVAIVLSFTIMGR